MSSNIIELVPDTMYGVNDMGTTRRWFRATPERVFMDMDDRDMISISPTKDIRDGDEYTWYTYGGYTPSPLRNKELIDLYLRYETLL